MPRAERLSNRLETLLEAIFEVPPDPFSLYWDIAAQLRRDQLAQAQTKIRKTLRQKGEIGAESAVLVACVLHLTGFPAHRILHFLSLYVPGGIRLSLFELAVSAIFLGEPPIPASLLYDITQYTYLEKRLLVRKSIEISDTLKGSLSPAVLLHLYLLSLRDDLSNENVQLIALIMKNCFPAQEVRTRIGGASLEEYGEIARAWRNAEKRSLDLEINRASGAEGRGARAFDRDSASYFLDKYFSDEALSEMRASAPLSPSRPVPPKGAFARKADSPAGAVDETRTVEPSPRAAGPVRHQPRAAEPEGPAAPGNPAVSTARRARTKETGGRVVVPAATGRTRGTAAAASARTPSHGKGRERIPVSASPLGGERGTRAARADAAAALSRRASLLLRSVAPTVIAAVVVAVILVAVPAGFRAATVPGTTAPAAASAAAAPPAGPAPVAEAPVAEAAAVPSRTTYVVRPGDSLWKIFGSLRAGNPDRAGWTDFLSRARSLNGLDDPDQLQPGKVLTLSVQK
ncbi:MAG: LysM peptidoglycan-binding domain-containing protein [Spirochaetia bacterium]